MTRNHQLQVASLAISIVALGVGAINWWYFARQVELAEKQYTDLSEFSVVIMSDTLQTLRSPLENGKKVEVAFFNDSQRPYRYRVSIESDGFGVYPTSAPPSARLTTKLDLDDEAVVVSAHSAYRSSFAIAHGKKKYNNASLRIKVNGQTIRRFFYDYDYATHTYVPRKA